MANNYGVLRSWDYIWERMSNVITGGNSSGLANPFGAAPLVIDEPATFYVDQVAGSDSADGSTDRPFKTVKGAVDYLKRFSIGSATTISLTAGTHDGFTLADLNFDGTATQASLTIQGSYTASAVTTGLNTGVLSTLTSGVLTDGTQTWTVDDLKGKWLRLSANANGIKPAGFSYFPISGNTATTITIPSQSALGTLANNNYAIVDAATVIAQNRVIYSTPTSTLTVSVAIGNSGGLGQSFNLKGLRFDVASSIGVRTFGNSAIRIEECQFNIGNASGISLGNLAFNLSCCMFKFTSTAGTGVLMNNLLVNTGSCSGVVSPGCFFWGSVGAGTTTGVSVSTPGRVSVTGTFDSLGTGVGCGSTTVVGISAMFVSSAVFTNCTTAIGGFGPQCFIGVTSSATGSGVTTFISINKGAKLQLPAIVTALGTTELSVDGVTSTIAAMRANSPKIHPLTPNPYGSYVFE